MSRLRTELVTSMWPSGRSPHYGVFVQNQATALRRAGVEVFVAAAIRGQPEGRRARWRAHADLAQAIWRLRRTSAELILLHAPSWFAGLTKRVATASGKTLVVHTHGGEAFPASAVERASRPTVASVLREAAGVISPSRYYARLLAERFAVAPERLFVSPSGGVDTEQFCPGEETLRKDWGVPQGSPCLGFVGRLVEDKGHDTFLRVLRAIPEAFGVVVGGGPEEGELRRSASRAGVSGRLRIEAFLPPHRLPAVYRSLDVLLFPTRRPAEALGLVPIEAMAAGTPVVGSDAFAVPEYLRSGESGFLVPPRDPEGFLARTRDLLAMSSERRAAFRAAARRQAEAFDSRRVAEELAEILRELARREGT